MKIVLCFGMRGQIKRWFDSLSVLQTDYSWNTVLNAIVNAWLFLFKQYICWY